MPEHDEEQSPEPDLSAIEGNLFEALFSFHEKTMDLLRQSSLDDDELKLVTERMKTLLEDATSEMQRTKDLSKLAPRLEPYMRWRSFRGWYPDETGKGED